VFDAEPRGAASAPAAARAGPASEPAAWCPAPLTGVAALGLTGVVAMPRLEPAAFSREFSGDVE